MKEVMPKDEAVHIQPACKGSDTAKEILTIRQKTVSQKETRRGGR